MTLTLETSTDVLTLNVPQDLGAEKRLRLAVALFDAQLLTQGQAAAMAGLSRIDIYNALGRFGVTPFQYSWEEAFAEADLPDAQATAEGEPAKAPMTDAEFDAYWGPYIGVIHGSHEPMSENCGEKFAEGMAEKRRQGHL